MSQMTKKRISELKAEIHFARNWVLYKKS
jgi:hypothetical protein